MCEYVKVKALIAVYKHEVNTVTMRGVRGFVAKHAQIKTEIQSFELETMTRYDTQTVHTDPFFYYRSSTPESHVA